MTERTIRIKVDASGAKREIGQIDGQMRNLGGTTDKLQTQLTRVASAIATAFSVRQIVAYADAYTSVQNRLRIVTSGTEELTEVTGRLLLTANDTRASFEATAGLFSTLARSTEELNISQERLIGITRTINQTFAISGASAQASANAITQLSQAFASGALRGEEFNSIADQAPDILRAVSIETGKSRGELREYAATGAITTDLLIRSLENYADTAEKELAKTNRTFEQSTVIAKNNAIAFVGSSELIQEATAAAGNTLVALSNNLETVGEVLTFVAAVVAGRFIGALSASAVTLINNSRAALTAKVQTDALGVSIARTSAAANAGAIAARGLSASMAFLGGPAGVVLLAASALLIFSNNAEKAEKAASEERLGKEITELISKFKELNEQGKAITFQKLTNEQLRLGEAIRAAASEQERLEKLAQSAANSGGLGRASQIAQVSKQAGEVKKLSAELDEITKKQEALFAIGLPEKGSLFNPDNGAATKLREIKGELEQLLNLQLDNLLSGSGLFGGLEGVGQDDQTAARINSRIEGLKLETQTISSELALQQAVRQGFLTQEQADLDLQTATKIQKAITERDLLLAEKNITDEQRLAAEIAFNDNVAAISQFYADQRLEVERQTGLQIQEIQNQTQQNYLDTASTAIGALSSLVGGSSKAAKALKLVQGGVNAFQVYAASEAAAALVLATPPGPVLNPSLIPLAASISAKGKASAAAILAGAAASTFSGVSSRGFSGGGGAGASASAALPTTPTAAANVQTLEIVGLREEIERLEAADGFVSTQFVAKVLDKIDSANRLRGEG